MIVWIVTCWNKDEDPIVTPWDNEENARLHLDYCKRNFTNSCIDKCNVYHTFKENGMD